MCKYTQKYSILGKNRVCTILMRFNSQYLVWPHLFSNTGWTLLGTSTTDWDVAPKHDRASAVLYRWLQTLTVVLFSRSPPSTLTMTWIRLKNWLHHSIKPVATNFQSSSCSVWHTSAFSICLLSIRTMTATLLSLTHGSAEGWLYHSGAVWTLCWIFSYFLRTECSDTVNQL